MNHKEFEKIVDNRLAQCRETLCAKGGEYSRDGDRLHNFKTAARIACVTPERSLFGMYLKHLVSVMDMIADIDNGELPTRGMMAEKIGDSINYHLLFEGLLEERIIATESRVEK